MRTSHLVTSLSLCTGLTSAARAGMPECWAEQERNPRENCREVKGRVEVTELWGEDKEVCWGGSENPKFNFCLLDTHLRLKSNPRDFR